MCNYIKAKYPDFKNCLQFKTTFNDAENLNKQSKISHKTEKLVQDLYDKIVPDYLVEDHPTSIPEIAKRLIK